MTHKWRKEWYEAQPEVYGLQHLLKTQRREETDAIKCLQGRGVFSQYYRKMVSLAIVLLLQSLLPSESARLTIKWAQRWTLLWLILRINWIHWVQLILLIDWSKFNQVFNINLLYLSINRVKSAPLLLPNDYWDRDPPESPWSIHWVTFIKLFKLQCISVSWLHM